MKRPILIAVALLGCCAAAHAQTGGGGVARPAVLPSMATNASNAVLPDARTNLGLGTASTPVFAGLQLGPAITPAVLMFSQTLLTPTGVIPAFRDVSVCLGNNSTFIGCSGGYISVGDNAGVTSATKGVLYGLQISLQPLIEHGANSPYDDAAALVIANDSPTASPIDTESIYIGHNSAFTAGAHEFGVIIGADANATLWGYGSGTYSSGLDFAKPGCGSYCTATISGAALHVPNNTYAVASVNAAKSATINLLWLDNSNVLNLAAGKFTINPTTGAVAASGPISTSSTLASTNIGTGSGIFAGGVGITGDVNIGGTLSIGGAVTVSGAFYNVWNGYAYAGYSDGGATETLLLHANPGIQSLIPMLKITNTADSTTTTTGALQIAGGLGVAKSATFGGTIATAGYAVAALPVAGTRGRRAYVTDQLTSCPALNGTFTGGGSVVCAAFDNGTAWVSD